MTFEEYEAVEQAIEAARTSTYTEDVTDRELTDEEKLSGDYDKGHFTFRGLDIVIENPRNSVRIGVDNEWRCRQAGHYGYIANTVGADGDEVDIIFGSRYDSSLAVCVNMFKETPNTGSFDEHKILLGFDHPRDALKALVDSYEEGYTIRKGWVYFCNVDQVREWLSEGDLTQPATEIPWTPWFQSQQ